MFKSQTKTYLYKACPRCRGDLILDADVDHVAVIDDRLEYVCLQCGCRASIEASSSVKTPAAATRAA